MDVMFDVDSEDPAEDLRLSANWRAKLTMREAIAYETLAEVVRGTLPQASLKTLARHIGISFYAMREALFGLQVKGLLSGLPELQ